MLLACSLAFQQHALQRHLGIISFSNTLWALPHFIEFFAHKLPISLISTNNLMITTFLSKSLLKISCERCIENEALDFACKNLCQHSRYWHKELIKYKQTNLNNFSRIFFRRPEIVYGSSRCNFHFRD